MGLEGCIGGWPMIFNALAVQRAERERRSSWTVSGHCYSTRVIPRPILATSATELPEGPQWTYDVKWDGFDLVPIDLVDGSGDELVIVRIPGHASPPLGIELRIWKLGATFPVDLVEPLRVAGRP